MKPTIPEPARAIAPITLAAQVYEYIKDSIVKGRLLPGQRLSDLELAEQLKVSRSPIREAIQRLAHDGLVKLVPHKGASVVQVTPHQVEELFDIRESLEALACRLACGRASSAAIAPVRRKLEQAARKVRKGILTEYPQSDVDFHRAVVLWSGNRELEDFLDMVHRKILLVRYRSGSSVSRAREAIEEHMAIADAIEARDAERAEAAMRAHVRKARANILRLLSEAGASGASGEPRRVRVTT